MENLSLSEIGKPKNDEEAEETYPVDISPEEIVLSFDHVLDQIFSFLDTPDLLTCRLVSHRFLRFARGPLEKRTCTVFYHGKTRSWREGKIISGRTLTQLSEFLEKSASAQDSNHNLISLPCTAFVFYRLPLTNNSLQAFFSINGQNIRKLSISPTQIGERNRVHENVIMERLCNLLAIQAPRLESLSLRGLFLIVEGQQGIPNQGARNENSSLLNTDPEFKQIITKVESLSSQSNLKFLQIIGEGVSKTTECLIQLAPKLQEVFLGSGRYIQLLQPVNRIHLLKSMFFVPVFDENGHPLEDRWYSFDIGTMEKMSLDENLRLRELKICFRKAIRECQSNSEFVNRVVLITNRILEGSKDTLEVLTLSSVTFLRGIKMPTVMPKLRELKIKVLDFHEIQAADSTIFPKGFSFPDAFPKLTSVVLSCYPEYYDDDLFYKFLNCLDFGGDGPITALSLKVKEVILGAFDYPIDTFKISAAIRQRIQKFFPRAEIITTKFGRESVLDSKLKHR